MNSIREYRAEARLLSADEFVERYPYCAFVIEPHVESEEGFNTLGVPAPGASQDRTVAPIRKQEGGTGFLRMITIGRAGKNDIRVKGKGVSKFHAFVMLGTDGSCVIKDADSTFGTWVQDQRLDPKADKRPLVCGDAVRLGDLRMTFYTPAGLFERLSSEEP